MVLANIVTINWETIFDVDGGAGISDVKIDKAKGMSKFDIETIDIVKFIQDKLLLWIWLKC